jgi:hypothetical protein
VEKFLTEIHFDVWWNEDILGSTCPNVILESPDIQDNGELLSWDMVYEYPPEEYFSDPAWDILVNGFIYFEPVKEALD